MFDESQHPKTNKIALFQEYVSFLLRYNGLTQRIFCDKYKLNSSSFNTYLKNGSGGGKKYLSALASEFNISLDEISELRDSNKLFKLLPCELVAMPENPEGTNPEDLKTLFQEISELKHQLAEAKKIAFTVERENGDVVHIRRGETSDLALKLLGLDN